MEAPGRASLAIALDTPDLDAALGLWESVRADVGVAKVGLELFLAAGRAAPERLRNAGADVFLDLKLHDIPNTVSGAVRAVLDLDLAYLTLHAGGGAAMIEAAVKARDAVGARTRLLAVTVLTHLDDESLAAVGVPAGTRAAVEQRARLAFEHGADGVVCSPLEARALRDRFGGGVSLVTPGIRFDDDARGDQTRTATPDAAIRSGASLLVVGRPIRDAASPAHAAHRMREAIAHAQKVNTP